MATDTLAQLAERAEQADEIARLFRAAAEKIEAARAGVEQAESRAAAQLDEARRNWWRVPAPGLYLIGEGSMDRVAESTAWTDEQLAAWVALDLVRQAVSTVCAKHRERGDRDLIQTLRYCRGEVEQQRAQAEQIQAPGRRDDPPEPLDADLAEGATVEVEHGSRTAALAERLGGDSEEETPEQEPAADQEKDPNAKLAPGVVTRLCALAEKQGVDLTEVEELYGDALADLPAAKEAEIEAEIRERGKAAKGGKR